MRDSRAGPPLGGSWWGRGSATAEWCRETEGHTGSARGDRAERTFQAEGAVRPLSPRRSGFRREGLCQPVRGEADVGGGAYKDRCLWNAGWEAVWTKQRVAWLSNEWIFPKERGRAEWDV